MCQDFIVSFHIGRGGRFHNAGHRTFNPYVKRLSDCFSDSCTVFCEDEEGNPLPDEKWQLIDGGGNVVLEGRSAIESVTGILDWDGEYDTDIVKYLSECSEDELETVYQFYLEDGYMDGELKDAVCSAKGLHRIQKIDFSSAGAVLKCQDTTLSYSWNGKEDVTEEDAARWMEEQGVDPVSIKRHADKFESRFCKE